MRRVLLLGWLAFGSMALANPWELEPPPRGRFTLDSTSTLSAQTVSTLEEIARAIDASGTGQLGVAVISTTSGVAPRTFATNLFNHWGIGHASRNDGVLVMIALADRKAELVVGSSNPLSTAVTDVIMRDDIVANMKRQDVDGAVLAAARSVQAALGPPSHEVQTPLVEYDAELSPYVRAEKAFPEQTPRQWVIDLSDSLNASARAELEIIGRELYDATQRRLVFLIVSKTAGWPSLSDLVDALRRQLGPGQPLGVVAFNVASHEALVELPDDRVSSGWERQELARIVHEMEVAGTREGVAHGGRFAATALRTGIPSRPMGEVLREWREQYGWVGWGGLGGGLVALAALARRWWRNRPRACEECHQPRERLSDDAEDAHLSAGQLAEETIKSVDYDVWFCGRCNDALVLRYGAIFSRYGHCQSCGRRTASSSSRTISFATEHSTGLVEITERCTHCAHVHTFQRTTARITKSSSSSSWSSSSSRSSSSFGGGRSSGSGSSGSW